MLCGDGLQSVVRGAGDRFRQPKQIVVFFLTGIRSRKEFLQADKLAPAAAASLMRATALVIFASLSAVHDI